MDDLEKQICLAYEEAQAAELKARQCSDNRDCALAAAEHFQHAAQLSEQQADSSEYSDDVRRVARVLADYYLSQSHKMSGWHAYERHDCDKALTELAHEREHLDRAVRDAEGLLPELPQGGVAFLKPQLESWKASIAEHKKTEYSMRARKAWDEGNTVEAIDWYRHSMREAEALLSAEVRFPTHVNPAAERIRRGNLWITIANAHQASAEVLLNHAKQNKRSLYDFSRDEGLRFLGHLLKAYHAGTAATTENPEWGQIGEVTQVCRENIEEFLNATKEQWGVIYARYSDDNTLKTLMKHMDSERYAMAKGEKILRQNKAAQLWAIGSFFVFAFLCVAGTIMALARVVPAWSVLPCIIGIEVLLLFIGAFTLRGTEDLSQTTFLRLVALAARFQFRSLLVFNRKGKGKNKGRN